MLLMGVKQCHKPSPKSPEIGGINHSQIGWLMGLFSTGLLLLIFTMPFPKRLSSTTTWPVSQRYPSRTRMRTRKRLEAKKAAVMSPRTCPFLVQEKSEMFYHIYHVLYLKGPLSHKNHTCSTVLGCAWSIEIS